MSASLSDTDNLVYLAGQGDELALRELFERNRSRLKKMVAVRMDGRLVTRFDPSDVVQETLITATAQMQDYARRRSLPFYPWLRQIAWQRLVDLHKHHLMAQRRSVVREVGMHLSDHSTMQLIRPLVGREPNPSQALQRDETRSAVRQALAALPHIDREVLVMRHLEQMSVAEIAAVLGISESAVKMRRLRAVRKLRESLSVDL